MKNSRPKANRNQNVRIGSASEVRIDDFLDVVHGASLSFADDLFVGVDTARNVLHEYSEDHPVYGASRGVGTRDSVSVADPKAAIDAILYEDFQPSGIELTGAEVRGILGYRAITGVVSPSGLSRECVEGVLAALDSPNVVGHQGDSLSEGDLAENSSVIRSAVEAGLISIDDPRDALGLVSHIGYSLTKATQLWESSLFTANALLVTGAMSHGAMGFSPEFFTKPALCSRPTQEVECGAQIAAISERFRTRQNHRLLAPISFRCQAQEHAATSVVADRLRESIESELRSGSDNPTVDIATRTIAHTGNFHATMVAQDVTSLCNSLVTLASSCEQRIVRSLEAEWNEVNDGLSGGGSIDGGIRAIARPAASIGASIRASSLTHSHLFASAVNSGREDRATLLASQSVAGLEIAEQCLRLASLELACANRVGELRGWLAEEPSLAESIAASCEHSAAPDLFSVLDRLALG